MVIRHRGYSPSALHKRLQLQNGPPGGTRTRKNLRSKRSGCSNLPCHQGITSYICASCALSSAICCQLCSSFYSLRRKMEHSKPNPSRGPTAFEAGPARLSGSSSGGSCGTRTHELYPSLGLMLPTHQTTLGALGGTRTRNGLDSRSSSCANLHYPRGREWRKAEDSNPTPLLGPSD